jgi:uncharacterized protein
MRENLELTRHEGALLMRLRVSPGARRDRLMGVHGNALKLAVAAPPEDGKANAAVLAFLADLLDAPERDLRLTSGHASRDKRVCISGLTADDIRARLNARIDR